MDCFKNIQAREGGCDHFIFEGSPGVGKRTMILAMLRENFGPNTMLVCLKIISHYRYNY